MTLAVAKPPGSLESLPVPPSVRPPDKSIVSVQEAQLLNRVKELEATLADTRAELDCARAALAAQAEAHEADRQRWEGERANAAHDRGARAWTSGRDLWEQVDAAGVIMLTADEEGFVTGMNATAAKVLGCLGGPTSAKHRLSDLLHPDDMLSIAELATAARHRTDHSLLGSVPSASGKEGLLPAAPTQCQARVRSSEQPWQSFLFAAALARSGGSGVGSSELLYVGQDVSKLSRERTEAKRAAEDLFGLFQTVNAPIIGIDQMGLINRWNRKAELLTGYSEAEAIGKDMVRTFVLEENAGPVQAMINRGLQGQEITSYEFPLVTKVGQQRQILWSATARRDHSGGLVGVIGVGQDITELRAETNMHANYIKICGAAVWSLRGQAATGEVTECRTKEIEHLISQQSEMDICDPRMVLWRASFVSILKIMCQSCWMSRRQAALNASTSSAPPPQHGRGTPGSGAACVDFGYEFCFESPSGQVKWYKVEGHFLGESAPRETGTFEVAGSMQEVTEMWIDKVMGDRRSSMWSRMCHMVFDATLLVDTQEYRVLNAWGEEKVFGCKLSSNQAIVPLIKPEDTSSLKEAFNEVTFKGFERGRTLRLLRPNGSEPGRACETPAQCFLLAGDPENPNECMMGIRMQGQSRGGAELWDVAKPNPVMTLEDLARLKSGLKRHRRPGPGNMRGRHMQNRHSRSTDPVTSSLSLSSIPEDWHGESEDDDARSIGVDTESLRSSSKSSKSSRSSKSSGSSLSGVGVCNSSPPRSASDEVLSLRSRELAVMHANLAASQRNVNSPTKAKASPPPTRRLAPKVQRTGPPRVKLRWGRETFDLNLDDFPSIRSLREHIQGSTGVPPARQTLILAGRRLPQDNGTTADEPTWNELRNSVRTGQALMLIGSAASAGLGGNNGAGNAGPDTAGAQGASAACADEVAGEALDDGVEANNGGDEAGSEDHSEHAASDERVNQTADETDDAGAARVSEDSRPENAPVSPAAPEGPESGCPGVPPPPESTSASGTAPSLQPAVPPGPALGPASKQPPPQASPCDDRDHGNGASGSAAEGENGRT